MSRPYTDQEAQEVRELVSRGFRERLKRGDADRIEALFKINHKEYAKLGAEVRARIRESIRTTGVS